MNIGAVKIDEIGILLGLNYVVDPPGPNPAEDDARFDRPPVILAIDKGSPAEQAGLVLHGVLKSINGEVLYADEAEGHEKRGWTIARIADVLRNGALPIQIGWNLPASDVQRVTVIRRRS